MGQQELFAIIGMILCLLMGFIFGRFGMVKKHQGIIAVELSDDGEEREIVRFILPLQLDEIKTRQQIIFKVENNTSQKSQAV